MKNISSRVGAGVLSAGLLLGMTGAAYAAPADRYAGADRYQTAITIAKSFVSANTVYIARGDNQADAVAGGKLKDGPLLLLNGDSKVQADVAATITSLGASNIVVLGGANAVADAWVKAATGGKAYTRLSGASRYGTAVEISKKLNPSGPVAKVYLANGQTLVDALAGGTIQDNFPILLAANANTLPEETLNEIKRLAPGEVVALGGANAISDAALNQAAAAAKGGMTKEMAKKELEKKLAKDVNEPCFRLHGWSTVVSSYKTSDFFASDAFKSTNLPYGTAEEKALAEKVISADWPRVCTLFVEHNSHENIWVDPSDPTGAAVDFHTMFGSGYVRTMETDGKPDLVYTGAAELHKSDGSFPASPDLSAIKDGVGKDLDLTTASNVIDKSLGQGLFQLNGKQPTKLSELMEYFKVSWPGGATLNASQATDVKAALLNAYSKVSPADISKADAAIQDSRDKDPNNLTAAMNKLKAGPTEEEISKQISSGSVAKTSRLAGNDRYGTAAAIAAAAYPNGDNAKVVYLANGTASADATVGGFIDNKDFLKGPMLLIAKDSIPASVNTYLQAVKAKHPGLTLKALGGDGVVSETAIAAAKTALGAK